MSKDEFSVEIPADAAFRNVLIDSLSADPTIEFEESPVYNLREDIGSLPEVIGYIISFKTAAALTLALKYTAPIIIEFIKKNHRISVEANGTKIEVTHPDYLEKAITAANALSNQKAKPQSPKSKK